MAYTGNEAWNRGGANPNFPKYVPYHAPMRYWTFHNWGALAVSIGPILLGLWLFYKILKMILTPKVIVYLTLITFHTIAFVCRLAYVLVVFALAPFLAPTGFLGMGLWNYCGNPYGIEVENSVVGLIAGTLVLPFAIPLSIIELFKRM